MVIAKGHIVRPETGPAAPAPGTGACTPTCVPSGCTLPCAHALHAQGRGDRGRRSAVRARGSPGANLLRRQVAHRRDGPATCAAIRSPRSSGSCGSPARLARARQRRLVSIDKANVLETSRLWREVCERVDARRIPRRAAGAYARGCRRHAPAAPPRAIFDVAGDREPVSADILTDEASMLRRLPGAPALRFPSGEGRRGLYEPIHGFRARTSPGRGIANPFGAILSAALLLRHSLGLDAEAAAVGSGRVRPRSSPGVHTADIARAGENLLPPRASAGAGRHRRTSLGAFGTQVRDGNWRSSGAVRARPDSRAVAARPLPAPDSSASASLSPPARNTADRSVARRRVRPRPFQAALQSERPGVDLPLLQTPFARGRIDEDLRPPGRPAATGTTRPTAGHQMAGQARTHALTAGPRDRA